MSEQPQRGEIWRVKLEPTRGGEIDKDNRPVLVLSRPGVGTVGVSLCAPITDYKPDRDKRRYWRVVIGDNEISGLDKLSCADVSQTRALDVSRFVSQDGKAHPTETQASAAALAQCVGYTPSQPVPLESTPEP
jgi:mRNA-degrading endonuclease toxin of MazEF toxin-antitoxin module